jgi:hypothetical protein
MEAKKFTPLEIENIDRYLKSRNLNVVKDIDELQASVPPEKVKEYELKTQFGYKMSLEMIVSLFYYKKNQPFKYKNGDLFPSTILSIYKGLKHKHVFHFTDDIFFKLMNTEIKTINPELIKMAFDTMVISIPHINIKIKKDLNLTFKDIILQYNEKNNSIIIQCFGEAQTDTFNILEQSGLELRLNLNSVPDMLNACISDLREVRGREKSIGPIEDDIKIYSFYFNFIINALLYITSVGDYETTPAKFYSAKKKKNKSGRQKEALKIAEKNKELSKISRIVIGSNRKLSEAEYESVSSMKNIISCPVWLVRGHWRNQPYGEHNSLRKAIWIKPFTKGKGVLKELEQKEYVVK